MNIETYVSLLSKQRLNNPRHPKLYNPVPLTYHPDMTVSYALLQVLNEAYIYTGIIESEVDIYPIYKSGSLFNDEVMINDFYSMSDSQEKATSSNLYYEFVYPTPNEILDKWKYLYLPVYPLIEKKVAHKLPFIVEFDTPNLIYSKLYPRTRDLTLTTADEQGAYYTTDQRGVHPYHPNMSFTGRISPQSNSILLYEYSDNSGYYGRQEDLYLSPHRPLDLNYPIDLTESFSPSSCMVLGDYPATGTIPLYGASLNLKTNPGYDPLNTYYVYRKVNGDLVLIESGATHPYSKDFISLAEQITGLTIPMISLPSSPSNQRFIFRQQSTFNEILNLVE